MEKSVFRVEQLPMGVYTIIGSKAAKGLCSSPYCEEPLIVLVQLNGKWWGRCLTHLTK